MSIKLHDRVAGVRFSTHKFDYWPKLHDTNFGRAILNRIALNYTHFEITQKLNTLQILKEEPEIIVTSYKYFAYLNQGEVTVMSYP